MLKLALSHRRRPLFVALLAVFFALVLAPRMARAAGSVTFTNLSPQETAEGRWKLKMTLNMGSKPDLPHVPMLFVFTPQVLYERSLEDKTGDKPVLNRKPLVNQQSINESIDVDFSSAGKIWPSTKFDFEIRRDKGYEAGEYSLVVKREADGVQIGAKQTLRLMGDNPIVDRRAIVFSGEKKKKVDSGSDGDADKSKDAGTEDKPAEGTASDTPPSGDAPPSEGSGDSAPPPVPPKQGGCGCRMAGEPGAPAGALALLALGAVFFARRRGQRPNNL